MPTPDILTDEELMQLMNSIQEPSEPPVVEAPLRTKGALRRLYPEQARNIPCPKCSTGKLELKDGRRGLFYGCSTWGDTRCTGSLDADQQTGAPMSSAKNRFIPFKEAVAALPPRETVSPILVQARNTAKNALTKFYKNSGMDKDEAQAWLKTKLNLDTLNLAELNEEVCNKITAQVKDRLRPRNRFELID